MTTCNASLTPGVRHWPSTPACVSQRFRRRSARPATSSGFRCLAVAPATPFIAISRAVIDELTADQVRLVQRVVQGQENLARVTVHGGIPALVDTLGRVIDSAVCVIDRSGVVLAESGADTVDLVNRVRNQLHRDQRRRRGASRAVVDEYGSLTIQRLPSAGERPGHLAVSSARPLDDTERLLVGHAVALLSIELAKPARVIDAEHRLRKAVTLALLQDNPNVDPSLLRYFGFTPDTSITVVVFTDVGPLLPAEQQLIAALEDESARYLMANLRNSEGIALLVNADHRRGYRRSRVRAGANPSAAQDKWRHRQRDHRSERQPQLAASTFSCRGWRGRRSQACLVLRARHLQPAPEHPVTGRAPGDLCPLAGTDRRARQQTTTATW